MLVEATQGGNCSRIACHLFYELVLRLEVEVFQSFIGSDLTKDSSHILIILMEISS